jgi:site-specific recombinase XerD
MSIPKNNLQQLFEEYINECRYSRGLRTQTVVGYKAVFSHFSAMMPEVTEVRSLTVEMLNEFFKRIKTRERIVGKNTLKVGLEDSTVKTYGNKLNAFFVWSIRRKLITENPLSHIKLRHPEYKDKRALETGEVHKIFTAVTLHSKTPLILRRDTAMVALLFFCGLRLGEFISLQVIDIDMEKQILSVRAETSKSKKTRYVPIHPTALLHLREYIKERNKSGYKTEKLLVSSNSDKGLSRHGLKHWVKRHSKLSGVKFHLHRFRHAFACNLARNNANIIKIQKLMGHADPRMTSTYLRSITVEDCRDDINKLSI